MSLTSRRRTMLCSVAVLAISVAGCSTSNDQETSTGTSAPASLSGEVNDHGTTDLTGAGRAPSAEIELDDNYFGPTFLEVAPGATVKLELRNEGSRQHTVTTAGSVDVVVDPGQTGEVELTAPASGQLDFYCRFHKNTGMQGSVVVTSATTGAGGTPSSASSTSTSTTKASSGAYGY